MQKADRNSPDVDKSKEKRSQRWCPTRRSLGVVFLSAIALLLFYVIFYRATLVSELQRGQRSASARGLLERIAKGTDDGPVLPILMPAFDRPHYLRAVLDALARVNNIRKTVLVVSQDGNNGEVTEIVKAFRGMDVVLLHHTRPFLAIPSLLHSGEYATSANVFFLLRFCMDYLKAEGCIMLESDLEPSVDMYDYFVWTHRTLLEGPATRDKILTVNGYNHDSIRGNPLAFKEFGFTVWGWCMSKRVWPIMQAGWTWYGNWDITLERSIRRPLGLLCVTPHVSRIRVIGLKGVNFNIHPDSPEARRYLEVFVQPAPLNYTGARPLLDGALALAQATAP